MKIDYGTDRLDNKPQSDIYKSSIFGFTQQLKSFFFDRSLAVVMVPNGVSPLRALIKKQRTLKAETNTFPFFAVSLADTAPNTASYNAFALRRRGVLLRSKPESDSTSVKRITQTRVHLSPLTQTMQVSLVTKDQRDVLEFTPRWMDCAKYHYLSFQLLTDDDVSDSSTAFNSSPDAPIDIRVECDTTISSPDEQIDDVGEMFIVQTSATINTYNGVVSKKLSVSIVNLSYQLANSNDSSPVIANLERRVVESS